MSLRGTFRGELPATAGTVAPARVAAMMARDGRTQALRQAVASHQSRRTPRSGTSMIVAVPSFGRRARNGALWSLLGVSGGRSVAFLANIVLARILIPDDFGAIAVAVVVQTIALGVYELGTTTVLARGDGDVSRIAPSVWWITIASGLATSLAITALAPMLASCLGNTSAATVIRILAWTVFLAGVAAVPGALLVRSLSLGKRAIIDVSSSTVSQGMAIPLAMAGLGAASMAVARVFGAAVAAVLYVRSCSWPIRPRLDWTVAKSALRSGVPVAASNLVVIAMLNVDYITIGRLLDPADLGVYLLAFNLASVATGVLSDGLRSVALPVFGRIQSHRRLNEFVTTVVSAVTFVAIGVAALIAGLAEPMVLLVYGPNWQEASAVMIGLALFGAAKTLGSLFSDLVLAANQAVRSLGVQVVWIGALIPTMIFFVDRWGITGAGFAHAVVAWFVVMPFWVLALARANSVRRLSLAWAILPWLVAGTAAGYAAWHVAALVHGTILSLILGAIAGLLVYLVLTLPLIFRVFVRIWSVSRV